MLVIFGSGANGSYAPPQVGGKLCASFASLARYRLVAVEQQQAAAAAASAPTGLQGLFQRLSSSMGSLLFGSAAGGGAQQAEPGRPQLGDTVEITDAAHRHATRMAVIVQERPRHTACTQRARSAHAVHMQRTRNARATHTQRTCNAHATHMQCMNVCRTTATSSRTGFAS